ncbi:uncharacterized protein [Epargyreus clarus]|uniref:uncharacterized protein n=1 Tax=Epargyreus clarus TaxID=520877 RepID=UPI003C2DED55
MEPCSRPQKYCGVVSLRIGIYFKSFFNVILVIVLLRQLIILITNLIIAQQNLYSEFEAIGENFYRNISDEGRETIRNLQKTLTAFILVWIMFKTSYVIVICCTVWAIYKNKNKMLKVFLYINIPNWIFDVLVTLLAGTMIDIPFKIIMNITVLTEVYNLLAIRSEYKRLTGKLALTVSENGETTTYPNGFVSPPHRDLTFSAISSEIHCRTCTCNLTPILENPVTFQPRLRETENLAEDDPPAPDKELNFKEEPIIYNQNQLVERQSSVIDYDTDFNQPQSSGYFTSLTVSKNEEKKVNISDMPVIYDENQLNVGTSSVIKDK